MARGAQVAEALNDEHAMRDIKEDSIFSHVYNLWRAGRTDILKEQLKQLGALDANELADALGESNATPEEILKLHGRIDKAIKKVDKIKADLDKFEEKMPNPYRPWEINRNLNPEMYEQEYDDWQSFEDAKYFAVFASHSFSRAGERMEGIIDAFINNAAFNKTTGMNIGRLFSVEQMQNDAEQLRAQAKIYRENDNAKKADELTILAKKLENLAKNSNLFSVILGISNRSEALTDEEKADLKPIFDKALEQGVNLENLTDDQVQEVEDLLKQSFASYLNELIYKNNNGRVILNDELDSLFSLYKDWHKLGDDTRIMAKWVNLLSDPAGFNRMREVTRQARQRVYDNRLNLLKEQRARFYKKIIQNKFLQDLYDQFGVFVSKEDVEAFANNDRYPQLLDKDTMQPLKANDPRIPGIEELFDMYEEAEKRLVNARPIREDRGENAMLSMLASLANAEKSLGDKRTYDDLAKELGIDPEALETKVESSKVFDFIINSKFASAAEKKLAQRLKEKYPNAKVTFKKNHHSAMTYNESTGIVIDLRFAASNYQAGKTRAEYIILKGMMTGMTTSFLSEDPEFSKDIKTLMKEVEDAINLDPKLMEPFGKNMPLGLLSEQDFVNEAMTNPVFQALLNKIKSGEKKKSNAFGDFLKATRAFLKKLFGIRSANNSVLTQAVSIISNKIYSTDYNATKKAPTPPTPPTTSTPPAGAPSGTAPGAAPTGSATPLTDEDKINAISQETPIKDMPQELVDLLDEEYKKLIKMSRGVYSKAKFAAFVKSAPKAASIIEKWKRDEIKKLKGAKPTGGKKGASPKDDDDDEPVAISDEQRQALYNLGYSRRDIDGYEDEDGNIFQLVEPEDVEEIIRLGLRRSRKVAQGNFEEADAMIDELREKLSKKEFPQDKITDKGYTDENGVNWPRVSELLNKNFVNKDGTTRGTILDTVYREFMMNEINSVQELTARLEELSVDEKGKRLFTYSKGFVVNLYDSMQEVHDYVSDMGYKIVADIPTLWGEIDGRRAGTIDFLIYNEDKEFAIVDLKTSTVNLRRAYEDPSKDTYEYQKGHTIQQNGYRELLGQRTGLVPSALFVLPLLLKKNKAGSYEGVKTLPSKSRGLFLTVNMDKDIYELTGVAKSAEAFVPGETKKTTTSKPIINIYWGNPESSTNTRVLSNLAPRKFTWEGREYGSVEHAYQSNKSGTFDQATYDAYNNLKEIPGKQGPGFGKKIKGKAVQKDYDNLQLMRDLVVESFKQNPDQAALLLNYSDFTHTTNEVIDQAFLDGIRLAQKNAETAATTTTKPTMETMFPMDKLFKGTESGDILKVIGYTKTGVRFEVQQEGAKTKKNVNFTELQRLVKEGKLAAIEDTKDDYGFANLGNTGNQGLAIMEVEINKFGKHVIPNISRATPEQRAKMFSDIEELKKKYPEKNIVGRIENNNLIVEVLPTPVAPEVVKGSIIRMNNGQLVQVKNISKGKITVVPLMDDTAAEDVIDEADITDRQIVAAPAKKKTVKKTQDTDTKQVIDDSVAEANGLAASKDDQTKLANEAKEMTPEERRAALKEKLKNRCKNNG